MKLVKNFVFTVLLVSMLAINTMAGETQMPGAPAPPPKEQYVDDTSSTPVVGDTDTQQLGVDDLLYEALAALLSVY